MPSFYVPNVGFYLPMKHPRRLRLRQHLRLRHLHLQRLRLRQGLKARELDLAISWEIMGIHGYYIMVINGY